MEHSHSPFYVVVAYDATRDHTENDLKLTVNAIRMVGDILRRGVTLLVLGVLHKVPHPMGYQLKACLESFAGTRFQAIEEKVAEKVDEYVTMLLETAGKCEIEGVKVQVRITAGYPIRHVVLQEVMACNAKWVILDRHLRWDLKFYHKWIPCKIGLIQNSWSVEIVRSYVTSEAETIEQKVVYSMSKQVSSSNSNTSINEQTSISCNSFSLNSSSLDSINDISSASWKLEDPMILNSSSKKEKSDLSSKVESWHSTAPQTVQSRSKDVSKQRASKAPILCSACGTMNELSMKDSMKFNYTDIKLATSNFTKENLLGEGGFGRVFKGELKDGQLIAAKVRKEASSQGFAQFQSEVRILSFARHKNIVMLLGYCCKENLNILVYEYICNKSLDWHLFESTESVLELRRRHEIAVGTAKGLRFLHEECRGGPIIHCDVRPSNILLTHNFVPMLGDFGLAKWKVGEDHHDSRILGTLGYMAPEYAENGILSVRTDVYAFGIVLLQLISGRRVAEAKGEDKHCSLLQWAEPLIENLELHELVDQRLGKTYGTYQLYLMAKVASLCVQRNPDNRPSMGEYAFLKGKEPNLADWTIHVTPKRQVTMRSCGKSTGTSARGYSILRRIYVISKDQEMWMLFDFQPPRI